MIKQNYTEIDILDDLDNAQHINPFKFFPDFNSLGKSPINCVLT